MDSKYYILVTEWKYPTETGREIIGDFGSRDEAIVRAFELCDDECDNFAQATGCDYLAPDELAWEECEGSTGDVGGVIITPKNCLDEWFFVARVIEVENFG